ncbi:MAG: hypothetical protein ACOYEW_12825 [Anaerolineae bacterium]|jgi:hypothetical protein
MTDFDSMDYIHCPYLGKSDDRNSFYHQATRRHRCYRWEQPLPVRRQDQEQYCLSSLHVSCPRMTDASALPVPTDRTRRRRRRSLRILGMPAQRFFAYVVPMVLLFVAAVAAAAILVRDMAAPPLPTALAAADDQGTATATATPTPFPTWTATPPPASAGSQQNTTAPTPMPPTPTPVFYPTPILTPPGPVTGAGTPVFVPPTPFPTPTRAVADTTFQSPLFDSPVNPPGGGVVQATPILATPPPPGTSAAGTAPQTPPDGSEGTPEAPGELPPHSRFVLMGQPVKTLLPSGVDVCAKVFGRVFNQDGINITRQVAVAVDWWPDNRLMVGEEGWPPINPDGTYEFCLTRGQFNLSVVAPKTTSDQVWIDLDEPEFTGQVVLEVNFQLVK